MKKLEKQQMETTVGGQKDYSYCELLTIWMLCDGGCGYQGSFESLRTAWFANCG